MVKTTLVFAKEIKAFNSFKSFQHASSIAVSLCKQSEGGPGKFVKERYVRDIYRVLPV